MAVLSHRGPDGHGTTLVEGEGWSCVVEHTRLAIVDLSDNAAQPIWNETETLCLTFNGEIYNSEELRSECEREGHRFRSRMDGEVILHLYESYGTESFERLNGIFAFALISTEGEVVIARDPLGVKPLFYSDTDGQGLAFASEISALLAAGVDPGTPDVTALAQFLTFLWIPAPRTPHSRVAALRPGHCLHWKKGAESRVAPYGKPLLPVLDELGRSDDELLEDFSAHFAEACKRQLMSDVPLGLMASGGIDSSLIWSATKGGLEAAYTIGWSEGGSERLDEDVAVARELAARFGTELRVIEDPDVSLNSEALPSGDLFADPAYQLTEQIAQSATHDRLKVLFSGQGGDELLGGYRRHRVARMLGEWPHGSWTRPLKQLGKLPTSNVKVEYLSRLGRSLAERTFLHRYMRLCSYSSAEERAQILGCTGQEVSDDVVWQEHRKLYEMLPPESSYLRRAMTLDLNVYLPGLGLAYVDRAGMQHGVEIRVPWLDLELVRWSLKLPDEALIRRGTSKWLSKEVAIETLGTKVVNRPKRGFAAPVAHLAGEGGKGRFRQPSYLERAKEVLDSHLADPSKS